MSIPDDVFTEPNPLPPSRRPKSLPSIQRDRHTVPWLLSSLIAEWTVATGPQAYDGAQPTAITSCQRAFLMACHHGRPDQSPLGSWRRSNRLTALASVMKSDDQQS